MKTHPSERFIYFLPFSGYLGPGGLHDDQKYSKCTGGAAGYIDEVILGKHIYQYAYITQIYKSKPFDPEGILGKNLQNFC